MVNRESVLKQDRIAVKNIIRIFVRRKWWFVSSITLVLVMELIYTFLNHRNYLLIYNIAASIVFSIIFGIVIVITGVLGLGLIIMAIVLLARKKPKKETIAPSIIRPVAGEPVPEAALKDLHGITDQMEYGILEKVTIIGREAGTKGDGIDYITIEKETISREHAVVEYKNHSFWIMDLGSTNGTLLNNQEVENETRLKDGDTITFDIYEFQFALHSPPQEEIDNMNKTVFRTVEDTLDD